MTDPLPPVEHGPCCRAAIPEADIQMRPRQNSHICSLAWSRIVQLLPLSDAVAKTFTANEIVFDVEHYCGTEHTKAGNSLTHARQSFTGSGFPGSVRRPTAPAPRRPRSSSPSQRATPAASALRSSPRWTSLRLGTQWEH